MIFADTLLMLRPANFGYNSETAASNSFQTKNNSADLPVQKKIMEEFDAVVRTLIGKGIDVVVEEDTDAPIKPDAVFPNNWISFHADGTLVLYPMFAPNRRIELRWDIVERARAKWKIRTVVDLSDWVNQHVFLEGTGSVVFDHKNKVAYACASPRTNKKLFYQLCKTLDYRPFFFNAIDESGRPVYHTNVLMCIGIDFVVLCTDCIKDPKEKKSVCESLGRGGYDLIEISIQQMKNFVGNMLTIQNKAGKRMVVLSERAYQSLTLLQKARMERDIELVQVSIPMIEEIGGGGVRCMLAEVFYAKNKRD